MKTSHLISILVVSAASISLTHVASAEGPVAKRLFFEGDMVRNGQPNQAGPFCVLTSQFKRKESVAWRIRVLDQTGQNLDDKGLKSVVIELSDGQKFPTKFGPHPPTGQAQDHFWATRWVIPADYPTGSLVYKVVATDNDGRSQTWEPFKRTPTQLTIIPGEPTPASAPPR